VVRSGRVFDTPRNVAAERGSDADVRHAGRQRGRWTYRDWTRWRFLWKFFPWYAREMRYRDDFCLGASCMHWFWEDAAKKERGYCSAAVSRTQHMMWAAEWENRDKKVAGSSS